MRWTGRLEGDDLKFLSKEQDTANPKKGFESRLDEEPRKVEPEVTDDDDDDDDDDA